MIGVCAESHCAYTAAIAFPDAVEVGLRTERLGSSSVRYELAVFRGGAEESAATGWFVHVFVDRATRRPVPIPAPLRAALSGSAQHRARVEQARGVERALHRVHRRSSASLRTSPSTPPWRRRRRARR